MGLTPTYGIPYPEDADAPDGPGQMRALALEVEAELTASNNRLTLLEGGFTAFTPAWTSSGTAPAIGNGTLLGAYKQVGKSLTVRLFWQAGSTTTFGTGTYSLSVPVNITAGISAQVPHFGAWLRDASPGADYAFFALHTTATTVQFRQIGSGTSVLWTATTPFTPASTDWFGAQIELQAA